MSVFVPSATQYCTFEKRFDSDGTVWLQVQSHDALTAKTPYGIVANEFGWISEALPASGKLIYVGVPPAAVAAAAEIVWLQIGGYITAMVTPALDLEIGHGLTVNSGAVADIGADYSGAAGEFAVATVAGGSVSVQTVMLIPERVLTI
jgi:hypothetical protein